VASVPSPSLSLASTMGPPFRQWHGVISGCYSKSGGSIRVIDSSVTNCKSNETAISWNKEGPAGADGAAGPAGPQALDTGEDWAWGEARPLLLVRGSVPTSDGSGWRIRAANLGAVFFGAPTINVKVTVTCATMS
jgi:hypothetical protein